MTLSDLDAQDRAWKRLGRRSWRSDLREAAHDVLPVIVVVGLLLTAGLLWLLAQPAPLPCQSPDVDTRLPESP